MQLIQLTGLSGAGKSTLAMAVKSSLEKEGLPVEIIDGDNYRKTVCKDLGFSREDRMENIRRLGNLAHSFVQQQRIAIIAAINPYEEVRRELELNYGARTVWIYCPLNVLIERDTKGLYKRAFLPEGDPGKLSNLSGVNDPYEEPGKPELVINTAAIDPVKAARVLRQFIIYTMASVKRMD
jgi:adenylylsulfate kinase